MSAAGPRRRKGASSIATANSTPTARRPASSSTRRAGLSNHSSHRSQVARHTSQVTGRKTRTVMADSVRYEIKDGVAVVTIDNPPVNALSPAVWDGIDRAVQRGVADPAAEAIVLIGAGTTCIAGADIKVFDTLTTKDDSFKRSAGTHALLRRMEDATKPLVAAIHGNALGGGLEVAQACHFRVATKDAKVGQPEVLLGIIPGAGGTQRLPRLAGVKMALDMATDGKPVPAPRALASGIVDAIVEND